MGDCSSLALVLHVSLQVGAEPLQLKVPVWVVTIVHFVQTCNTLAQWTLFTYTSELEISTSVHLFPMNYKNLCSYQQTRWNDSQCQRLGNCTQHTRSQWTLHFLETEALWFRHRYRKHKYYDNVMFPFDNSKCQGSSFHSLAFFYLIGLAASSANCRAKE